MPITATDYFVPGSQYIPYLLEDSYLKGGFRVFDTIAARDQYIQHAASIAWLPEMDSRKIGMLCSVIETDTIYKLNTDKLTWSELELGGSAELSVDNPLRIVDDVLSIDPFYVIPDGGNAGDVLTRASNGTLIWTTPQIGQGVRGVIQYTPEDFIAPGGLHSFTLDMPACVMLIRVELSAPEIKLEGWETAERTSQNPYTFVSSETQMVDNGIRDQNGEQTKFRRYSFLANQDEPVAPSQYFTLTNLGAVDLKPTVTITYLGLQ